MFQSKVSYVFMTHALVKMTIFVNVDILVKLNFLKSHIFL